MSDDGVLTGLGRPTRVHHHPTPTQHLRHHLEMFENFRNLGLLSFCFSWPLVFALEIVIVIILLTE